MILMHDAQGYLSGAIANVWLTDKLGFGKVSAFISRLPSR